MSLQHEWQYMQKTVPGVGVHMGPIEKALQEVFFLALFGELEPGEAEEMRTLWGHSVKQLGLGIPDLTQLADHCHETSQSCCNVLVASLLEGQKIPYVEHKTCMREGSLAARKARTARELQALEEMK
eukprot:10448366-Ditylum_brightwellii.AAC.1